MFLPVATDLRLSTLERQSVLCVGPGQSLQRGTRAVEDLRDATVELLNFLKTFLHLQIRDKFSSETAVPHCQGSCDESSVAPRSAGKDHVDHPLLHQVSTCAKRAQSSQSRAILHVALVHQNVCTNAPISVQHVPVTSANNRRHTHTTPTNNASILPTHVHENACLSRDRLCNSLATKKPHERKHTWRSKSVTIVFTT